MMRFEVVAIGASAALAVAGCHRASEPPKSLVGATKLPSPADLQKETIIIARMGGKDANDQLNIEVRPTDQVVAAHYRGRDRALVAQESLHVSAQQAESLRRMLWRLRPDDGAPAQKTIPLGCHYVYDAGFDWAVAYLREDKPANFLEFTLPYPEYCNTPAYAEARELIGAVVGALPRSDVVQRFPPGKLHPLGTYSP
jgi:hypothetical protein